MTREEALKVWHESFGFNEVECSSYKLEEAISTAFRELEKEPCEDCISREAVMKLLKKEDWADTVYGVMNLPSVIPQPKTGYWITQWNVTHQKEYYYCSECREAFSYDGETGIEMNNYSFCPNCGVKMEIEK